MLWPPPRTTYSFHRSLSESLSAYTEGTIFNLLPPFKSFPYGVWGKSCSEPPTVVIPQMLGVRSAGTHHTTNRFPWNKKASVWKEKKEVTLVPSEDYSASFPSLILQHRQISSSFFLGYWVLLLSTTYYRASCFCSLFATEWESARSRAAM